MEKEIVNTIAFKSEELNEVLSNAPNKLIRFGNSAFLLVIVIFISVLWLINYPDEVIGEVTITNSIPPIELRNQQYLELKNLFVKDGQLVKKNAVLAQFSNSSDTNSLNKVKIYLSNIESTLSDTISNIIILNEKINLGLIQEKWFKLNKLIIEWNNLHNLNILQKNIESIKKDINYNKLMYAISTKKIALYEKEHQLLYNELKSNETLQSKNIISTQEFNGIAKSVNNSLLEIQNQKQHSIQLLIAINSLTKELENKTFENQTKIKSHFEEIKLSITQLKSSIVEWETSSSWTATCDGKILFNTNLQKNKFYKPEEACIVIVPNNNQLMGFTQIPSSTIGKIQEGQLCDIEIESFPKTQYGTLSGNVQFISSIDNSNYYDVKINLKNGLKTNQNKTIPYKVKLKGKIKIITKNRRLLERILDNIITSLEK